MPLPLDQTIVYSVTDLTRRIRSTLERAIGVVWVEGELSNVNHHASGHLYFTLKDAGAQIAGVMFRGEAARLRFRLKDGLQARVFGRITVYEKRGNYQIVVEHLEPAGLGSLQAAFEALKRKLEAEGLFDPSRKRLLPPYPRAVGVVTSTDGAALRDFGRVLHRRFPSLRILVAPTRVQGDGAAAGIASAIGLLNAASAAGLIPTVDVLAVIRGGGSIEDLWAFNEEIVARAVARSQIPVISGVGHETDFTICDFVADARAATPSVAAEMVIRPRDEILDDIADHATRLDDTARLALAALRERHVALRDTLREREPRQILREWRQRLDDALTALQSSGRDRLRASRNRWQTAQECFRAANPLVVVARHRAAFRSTAERHARAAEDATRRMRHRLDLAGRRLDLLNPRATLRRGYSITLDAASGAILRAAGAIRPGQRLRTQLADGEVHSVTEGSPARPKDRPPPLS